MLKYVWYDIKTKNESGFLPLREHLEQAGVRCSRWQGWEQKSILRAGRTERVAGERTGDAADFSEVLFITDNPETSRSASELGFVCVGLSCDGMQCEDSEEQNTYFDGAGLVITADPEEIDVRVLEEYLLRECGLPVTIWEDETLLLREITETDIPILHAISREAGMEYARYEPNGEDSFSEECLRAYIRQQYRFYGYGLWSILKKETGKAGEVIGCCGFSEDETRQDEETDQVKVSLEMQYMLTEHARNCGYGTRICRAALSYAQEYLEAEQITVRVHPKNERARAFAEKLGFKETVIPGLYSI